MAKSNGKLIDAKSLEDLARVMQEYELDELHQATGEGESFTIVRRREQTRVAMPMHSEAYAHPPAGHAVTAPTPAAASNDASPPESDSGIKISSPMVGTFYASPSPEADAYVRRGQQVKKGDIICIVEAMKMMNHIKSDFAGTVISVDVENGQPVEFGQTIVRLKPE